MKADFGKVLVAVSRAKDPNLFASGVKQQMIQHFVKTEDCFVVQPSAQLPSLGVASLLAERKKLSFTVSWVWLVAEVKVYHHGIVVVERTSSFDESDGKVVVECAESVALEAVNEAIILRDEKPDYDRLTSCMRDGDSLHIEAARSMKIVAITRPGIKIEKRSPFLAQALREATEEMSRLNVGSGV